MLRTGEYAEERFDRCLWACVRAHLAVEDRGKFVTAWGQAIRKGAPLDLLEWMDLLRLSDALSVATADTLLCECRSEDCLTDAGEIAAAMLSLEGGGRAPCLRRVVEGLCSERISRRDAGNYFILVLAAVVRTDLPLREGIACFARRAVLGRHRRLMLRAASGDTRAERGALAVWGKRLDGGMNVCRWGAAGIHGVLCPLAKRYPDESVPSSVRQCCAWLDGLTRPQDEGGFLAGM